MKHKKCFGFLLIEVMLTLTALVILGGISLYFGGIIMQKVREERRTKKLSVRIWALGKQRISYAQACEALSRMLRRKVAPLEVHEFNNEVLWFLPKKEDEFAGYSCGF